MFNIFKSKNIYKLINKAKIDKKYEYKKINIKEDIIRYLILREDIKKSNSKNFRLVYQPQINLTNNQIESCEVLSRWNHPNLGQVAPNEFLKVVKDLNKEIEFDLMIFEKTCEDIFDAKDVINKFSVNVSVKSISNKSFIDQIYKITKKYQINPNQITLEVVEDIFKSSLSCIQENICILQELGYKVSLDDFGLGYSSYFRLASIDFSEIKIPREFIIIDDNKDKRKQNMILESIIRLLRKLKCKVVVEGVETEEQLSIVRSLNIEYVQGYYYSKPLNKNEYKIFSCYYNRDLEQIS